MLILVFIAISCFYPAIELTAGEKERGTLATLLTAPVEAAEIVMGKYLVVMTIGILAGLLNVSVMTLTVLRAVAGAAERGAEAPVAALPHLTPGLVLGLLAAVVLVAAVVAAVMLLAATFARSFRDANSLLTPVLLVVLAPAFLASFPSAALDARWAAVPIAGPVLWMKALLLDKAVGSEALGVVVSSAGTAFLLLGLATRVFGDERVLFASEGRRADARTLLLGAPQLGPGSALAFASVLFIGNFFLGAVLVPLHPLAAVLATQLVLHAGASWAFARWTRAPELLSVGRPEGGAARALAAAVLIGGAAWIGCSMPLVWLQGALVPGQEAASAALKGNLSLEGTPLVVVVLALAVVPAIAEELAFRGVVLGALSTRLRPASAILLSALLFAISHGSLFRLLPTLVLGVLLGLIARRTRTLWPSMLAHALNNGILLALDRASPEAVERLGAPTAWAAAGAAAVTVGVIALGIRLTRTTSAS
jgi:sodium transport system permease protein